MKKFLRDFRRAWRKWRERRHCETNHVPYHRCWPVHHSWQWWCRRCGRQWMEYD